MDAVAKEQWALAVLTARFDCSQQEFFQAEYGRRRRNPAVALALCLTLGAFGAHEFYLGRLTSAVLRLLFCWTLIPALIAVVEALSVTQRVHRYNTWMAHTLAEIVTESFAAMRTRPGEDDAELASWSFGMARTLEPAEPQRWSGSHPTQRLAEERVCAADTLAAASDTVPLTLEPAPELDTPREPRATRDNSMSANEPQPAIMGAEVATAVMDTPSAPPTPATAPKRIHRVVVRKVAMVDGQPVAEARATREVVISPWDEDVEARIEAAKAEARAEAMRKLSLLFPAGFEITDS